MTILFGNGSGAAARQSAIACVVLGGALLVGCATTKLARQDVLRQYGVVAKLDTGVQDARSQDGALLAPKNFAETKKQLDKAVKYASRADKPRANQAAKLGLASLKRLAIAMVDNRRVMEEVINVRDRAVNQGAAVLFKRKFDDTDERFRGATLMIEQGDTSSARKKRSELIQAYAGLELAALKRGTVAAARQAIAMAVKAEAKDHAPTTLQNAREELKLALSILDADRTQVAKSNSHARKATWLANRARVISDLIRDFDSQNLSKEQRILWYQDQLQRVRSALRDETLPFDRSNAKVIRTLRADGIALKNVMKESHRANRFARQRSQQLERELQQQRQKHKQEWSKLLGEHQRQLADIKSGNAVRMKRAIKDSSARIATLKKRLSTAAQLRADARRREKRSQARFDQVRGLFDKAEAEVFRQGDNVLVRLKGFAFKSSKHQVETRNYPLLNKVVAAINSFPKSTVKVTGHTDSQGSNMRNLELSAARAQSVAKFLSMVGGIDGKRLSAEGMGDKEPVASNRSADGRAKNRRIDLEIVNK
jgi:OOP family OmpA-OmpF porin